MTAPAPPSDRREELVDQALALIRESGLAGLTVRRLAERVGFTEGALYRHYRSKSELMAAVISTMGERLLGPIRELAADRSRTVAERMTALVRRHVGLVLDTDGLPLLLLVEAASANDEAVLAEVRKVLGGYGQVVAGLLAELPPDPRRPSAAELTLPLMGFAAAAALRRRVAPDPALEEAARGELAAFLVGRLLGPDLEREPEGGNRP